MVVREIVLYDLEIFVSEALCITVVSEALCITIISEALCITVVSEDPMYNSHIGGPYI